MHEEDLLRSWQSQPTEASPVSIEQLQVKVRAFRRRTRLGYVLECIAAVLVALGYGAAVWALPNPWIKAGSALIILAGVFIFFQFRKRWNMRAAPAESLAVQVLEFHRRELVRRRDMLRSSWVWYISPLVPGMLVYWLGMMQAYPQNPFNMIGVVACFAGFFAVGLLNEWRARRVQREIDALDGGEA